MISIWRRIHLLVAITISLFLIVVSVTGVILAGDIVLKKIQNPYKADNFEQLTLAQTISNLKGKYPEITEISIDHNQFVELQGISEEGNEVTAIVDPNNGKILGKPLQQSQFIKDITSLHRSLFLHEQGRFVVGLVSFFLAIIALTGIVMIFKRQKGIRKFFSKTHQDFFAQWFHIVAGKWLLIPLLIIAITGTYLFAKRFKIIPEQKSQISQKENQNTEHQVAIKDFPIFKNTPLSEVKKVEFPFMEDDPEESFILQLKDRKLEVNAFSGEITHTELYPSAQIWADISLHLHTGQTNAIWAVVLGIASLGVLGFIYTGFAITFRRLRAKVKNTFTADNAEIILLVGSENGTTLGFANQIQKQLLESGESVFLAYLNQYQQFKNAKKILVFTSTFGEGDAPTNAKKFEYLLQKFTQPNPIQYSVVGFGSRAYEHFCGYAIQVDQLLKSQTWATELVPIHAINDRSPEEFTAWVKDFSEKSRINLSLNAENYEQKIEGLTEFRVVEKSVLDNENETFSITFSTDNQAFSSGDILAIYPENNHKERQYSIGRMENHIQLFVKLHPFGLGSQFLHSLRIGQKINAKILENPHFHFPKNTNRVVMIANGTGIAPFLGMLSEKGVEKHLYCGFRYPTEATENFVHIAKKHDLSTFKIGYSKGEPSLYVMDLIQEDEAFFLDILQNDGVIMLCGALAMQKNVEHILTQICQKHQLKSLDQLKKEGKILADCY